MLAFLLSPTRRPVGDTRVFCRGRRWPRRQGRRQWLSPPSDASRPLWSQGRACPPCFPHSCLRKVDAVLLPHMHSFLFRYKETCEREKGRGGEDGFPGGSDSKESACNARDLGSVPGLRRSPGEGNGYSLQYSCLENSMDRGV